MRANDPSFLQPSTRGRAEGRIDPDGWDWLSQADPLTRADWRERLDWVASIDRLARAQLLAQDAESLAHHYLVPRDPEALGVSWCEAWQRYVIAAQRYYRAKVIVPDLAAHREMLLELGGNAFCLLPEVDWSLRRSMAHFGALDRYFLQLRDLKRDAAENRCYFPLHVLASFGLAPQDIADGSCLSKPGYRELMHFWLDEYLPSLRFEAAELSQARGLPRGLRLLRADCAKRQARIERVFREAGFDFRAADEAYWSEVDAEHRQDAQLERQSVLIAAAS